MQKKAAVTDKFKAQARKKPFSDVITSSGTNPSTSMYDVVPSKGDALKNRTKSIRYRATATTEEKALDLES